MEIGVMFWAGHDPYETVRELKSWGVRCGQMGIPGDMPLEGAAARWKQVRSPTKTLRWLRCLQLI
jgi:hypothetical protein